MTLIILKCFSLSFVMHFTFKSIYLIVIQLFQLYYDVVTCYIFFYPLTFSFLTLFPVCPAFTFLTSTRIDSTASKKKNVSTGKHDKFFTEFTAVITTWSFQEKNCCSAEIICSNNHNKLILLLYLENKKE